MIKTSTNTVQVFNNNNRLEVKKSYRHNMPLINNLSSVLMHGLLDIFYGKNTTQWYGLTIILLRWNLSS